MSMIGDLERLFGEYIYPNLVRDRDQVRTDAGGARGLGRDADEVAEPLFVLATRIWPHGHHVSSLVGHSACLVKNSVSIDGCGAGLAPDLASDHTPSACRSLLLATPAADRWIAHGGIAHDVGVVIPVGLSG